MPDVLHQSVRLAAIRRERAACLILTCEPPQYGAPARYEATALDIRQSSHPMVQTLRSVLRDRGHPV